MWRPDRFAPLNQRGLPNGHHIILETTYHIRLSDWLQGTTHSSNPGKQRRATASGTTTFMLLYSLLKRSSELQRLADSASMATPSLRHKHTRSKGPFLRRHY